MIVDFVVDFMQDMQMKHMCSIKDLKENTLQNLRLRPKGTMLETDLNSVDDRIRKTRTALQSGSVTDNSARNEVENQKYWSAKFDDCFSAQEARVRAAIMKFDNS